MIRKIEPTRTFSDSLMGLIERDVNREYIRQFQVMKLLSSEVGWVEVDNKTFCSFDISLKYRQYQVERYLNYSISHKDQIVPNEPINCKMIVPPDWVGSYGAWRDNMLLGARMRVVYSENPLEVFESFGIFDTQGLSAFPTLFIGSWRCIRHTPKTIFDLPADFYLPVLEPYTLEDAMHRWGLF